MSILKLTLLGAVVATAGACASSQKVGGDPPRQMVERLLQLYADDRARFVRHVQEMEQNKDNCDYVESVRKEAEKMDFDGSVPKEQQQNLVVVKMEVAEAEKICRD